MALLLLMVALFALIAWAAFVLLCWLEFPTAGAWMCDHWASVCAR